MRLLQKLELAAAARAPSAPSGASCVGQRQGLKGDSVPVLVALRCGVFLWWWLVFLFCFVFSFFIFVPQQLMCCGCGVSVGEIWEN